MHTGAVEEVTSSKAGGDGEDVGFSKLCWHIGHSKTEYSIAVYF